MCDNDFCEVNIHIVFNNEFISHYHSDQIENLIYAAIERTDEDILIGQSFNASTQ